MVNKIPKCRSSCARCNQRFAAGQLVTSVLSLTLSEEYVRSDFCEKCWQAPSTNEVQGVWRHPYPSQVVLPRGEGKEDARLLGLLLESEDAVQAYVLALYLVRRGVLTRMRQPPGATGTLFFEIKSTGEWLEVRQISASEVGQANFDFVL